MADQRAKRSTIQRRHCMISDMPPHGTGPGILTEDGCSVEVYARLPVGDEPEIISSVLPPGSSILEVCAGTGRIADVLAERKFKVVAVDHSADMLARVRLAETVCMPIENLDLGQRFDAVVFASHMINRADEDWCAAVLTACRRHVLDTGCVLIERRAPAWFDAPEEFDRQFGDLSVQLAEITRIDHDLVAGTFIYRASDGQQWTHRVTSRRLDNAKFSRELAAAGLAFDQVLDDGDKWVRAIPM